MAQPDADADRDDHEGGCGPRLAVDETVGRITLPVAEAPSAVGAFRRIIGPAGIDVAAFPEPDIRRPLRSGRYRVWRYDGVTAVAEPSAEAGRMLHEVGGEPWASPLSGLAQAQPLGALSLDELLGLLAHPPAAPEGLRWESSVVAAKGLSAIC